MEILKEYGIEEHILGKAGDNASVNDKTLDELEILFKEISSLIITVTHLKSIHTYNFAKCINIYIL